MQPPPSARELTRHLVARAAAQGNATGSVATAAHRACERAHRDLSRWIGINGADALFTRAVAEARAEHPFLTDLRVASRSQSESESSLDGVDALIEVHGATAVAAGLETVLAMTLELLGRLIGDDMATRLLEQVDSHRSRPETDRTNASNEGAQRRAK